VEDIVKVIFQLEAENGKAINALTEVNNKYIESNSKLKDQQKELRSLVAKETELLQARSKSNNPTEVARYNLKLRETSQQINVVKASVDQAAIATRNLNKESTTLRDQMRQAFDATKINAVNKELKVTENSFTALKKQLKDAKGELAAAFGSNNQAAIQAASQKVGKLKDQINDLNESTNAFASGSKFQVISNLFRDVGGNILAGDFERANEQSKALLATTKSLTFSEAKAGIGQLGGALANVGTALLTNPLFLLGAAFSILMSFLPKIIEHFGLFTSAAEKNAIAVAEMESSVKKANAALDGQIDILDDQIRKLKDLKAPLSDIIAKYKELEGIKLTKLANELKVLQEKQKGVSATLSTGQDAGGGDLASTVNRIGSLFFGPSKKEKEAAKNAGRENQAAIIQNANEKKKVERETANAIAAEEKARAEEKAKINKEAIDKEKEASEARIKIVQDLIAKREELNEGFAQKNAEIDQAERDAEVEAAKKIIDEDKAFREAVQIANAEDDAQAKKSDEERTERIKKQKELRLQAILAEVDAYAQVANAAINGSQQILSAKEQETARLAELQEKRVSDAKAIADQGNAEALELEQKRLDDINKKRQSFVQQQKALSLIEIGINTAVAVTKAASQGGVAAPIVIATTIAAILAGLAQAASVASSAGGSFYEGGYTGDGDARSESRRLGKKRYTYHKGEFVMNHDKTSQFRDIFEGIHKGDINLKDWQSKVKAFEAMRALSMVSNPNSANTGAMEKKLDTVIRAIEGQNTSVSLDENGLSMRFKKIRSRNDLIRNHLGRA
jgi:hypothetical protein